MQTHISRYLLGILAIFLTVGSATVTASGAAILQASPLPASQASGPANSGSVGQPYTITLITGDVLVVTPQVNGEYAVAITAAPRPNGEVSFQTVTDGSQGMFVIPSDVRFLLPNILDPTFFNLNYLISHHLTDEQAPYLKVIVQYANSARMKGPWSSSIVSSSELPSIHSQAITIPRRNAAEFGKMLLDADATHSLAGIQKIWLDRVYTAADDQSGPLIGAVYARNVLGYNGSGIKIAIIDTGIDSTHRDFFFPNGSSKIIIKADYECYGQAFDPNSCDGNTLDLFGHGTHVAGIAAGTGAASGGLYVGIAPGASLMNVKTLNRFGFGYDSWIIAAMQAAANGINGTKADVISMSLGDGVTDGTDPMSQAVNNLSASTGVVFVIAAGNSGGAGEVTVAAPGAATAAITVAASTKYEPVSIAYFSSRGPRTGDFSIKPDIAAPGVSIISTCSSTAIYLTCPTGSQYLTLSGTSMATPHVSGSVALLLQAARASGHTLTPMQVKNILQDSSRILLPVSGPQGVDIYQQGAGLVRIDHAITSNATFSPAELSFGLVPYNTTSTLKGTLQVTNRGTASQTLSLNWTMYDVPSNLSPQSTGSSYTSLVSLDKTSLTLAGGASSNVTVTINAAAAPYQKLDEIFSGRIIATSSTGEQEHAIFGFTKEGPRATLNVTGILPNGMPAAGKSYSIFDMNGPGLVSLFAGFNSNGQSILRVPPSTYGLVMELELFPPNAPNYQLYRITIFNLVVQNSTTAVLDARTALAVALNLQADPSATGGMEQDSIFSIIVPGLYWTMANILINGNWDFFGENPSNPHLSNFWTQDRWLRARSPYQSSPVLYDMAISRQQFGPATDTITSANLTTTTGVNTANIHSDFGGTVYLGRASNPAKFYYLGTYFLVAFPLNAPTVQTQYQQAGESLVRQMVEPAANSFWFDTTYTTQYFGVGRLLGKVWAAGESTSETYMEQPVHPALLAASRSGNTLSLTGYEMTDTFGHPATDFSAKGGTFTLNVFVNGVLNFTSSSFPCPSGGIVLFPRYPCTPYAIALPSASATVKIQMLLTPDPSWAKLAKTSQTSITFTTSSSGQGPLPNSKYVITGLNGLNQILISKGTTKLGFTIPLTTTTGSLFNATTATVQFSIDNGTTWSNAVTTIPPGLLTVKAMVPTSTPTTYVSLLVHAQSADGTALDQETILAIQIIHR